MFWCIFVATSFSTLVIDEYIRHVLISVNLSNCSTELLIRGHTCSREPNDFTDADPGDLIFHFANIDKQVIDSDGCQSFSLTIGESYAGSIVVGFSTLDFNQPADIQDELPWNECAHFFLNLGFLNPRVLGVITPGLDADCMGRYMTSDDTITISYNPEAGTMHAAYNLDSPRLLISNIPKGSTPMHPFVGIMESSTSQSLTLVVNPRFA